MGTELYGKDYFEDGIEKKLSCYQSYHWLPEMTTRFCMAIVEYLGIDREQKILDFGCSRGFMVKGFRILLRQAFGVETSRYCLANLDPEVREVVFDRIPENMHFDWVISKDTMEHISYNEIERLLKRLGRVADCMFCIIPLADNNEYRAPCYEMDTTHTIRENENWWSDLFEKCGWQVVDFRYAIKGMKENWAKDYPKGNGFWKLKRQ